MVDIKPSMLEQLPAPPENKTGWPWTEESSIESYENDTDLPKISIVTPSFNQGEYIEETIRSILLQNYPNLEYIVIDGGSKDETKSILEKYSPWINYWVSEPDKGQSDAINKGLKRCTGAVFNWLNSDDYYYKDVLATVGKHFSNKEVEVYGGYSVLFNSSQEKHAEGTLVYPNSFGKTLGWATIDQPATFFRRKILEPIGELNPALHYTMDREWWIKYLLYNGMKHVVKESKPLIRFRLHEDSKTQSLIKYFFKDRVSIMTSLAKQIEFEKYGHLISKDLGVLDNYTLDINTKAITSKQEDLKVAFNYFLINVGRQLLNQSKDSAAYKVFNQIDKALILQEDLTFLDQMYKKARTRHYLAPLVYVYRQLKGKLIR